MVLIVEAEMLGAPLMLDHELTIWDKQIASRAASVLIEIPLRTLLFPMDEAGIAVSIMRVFSMDVGFMQESGVMGCGILS
ncbi:hypothetical protein V6N12_009767 [Hibiscus sabdariffa]|uniref:Uncharacterized protein n=1 Tax=Hibiscus sabdariffa TaxID=183260 RepID=A0ABR2EBQ7_9ROSI